MTSLAGHVNAAGHHVREAEGGMEHGRLAGAVGADEAERLAPACDEVDAVEDLHAAVAGAQAPNIDGGIALAERLQVLPCGPFACEFPRGLLDRIHRERGLEVHRHVGRRAGARRAHQRAPR